jgi:hypothetical protein
MRNVLIAALLIALLTFSARAQGPVAWTVSGAGLHTTCSTPVAGSYFLCVATDGVYVSNNGGAYFQIVPPSTASGTLTGISVNGTAMVPTSAGVVALTVPTTAVSTTSTTIH